MKRKLIKQGIGALTITLPKEWISKYRLKAGDEINMEEHEKTLLLKTEGEGNILRKITIDIDNLNQLLIWRYLMSAYRLGYDEIILNFSDIEKNYEIKLSSLGALENRIKMSTIEVIQDITSRFIGMEIIDHGKNYCVIKDLGETSEKEFDNSLRRIFLLLLSMAEESLSGLKQKIKNIKNSIVNTDIIIDKFTDFCLRILNKSGYKKFNKTNSIYATIILFEFIGDEYKKIALHIPKLIKFGSKLINIYDDINKLLNLFYELFYKFNQKNAAKIYDLDEELTNKINNLKLKDEEKEILYHLRKIKRYITNLVQLRIDLEF